MQLLKNFRFKINFFIFNDKLNSLIQFTQLPIISSQISVMKKIKHERALFKQKKKFINKYLPVQAHNKSTVFADLLFASTH